MMVAVTIQIWLKIWQGLIEIQRSQVLEIKCLLNLILHQLSPKADSTHQFLRTVFDIKFFSISNFSNLYFYFLPIGDSCQYWMDVEKRTLSSPYYPQHFYDGVHCEWLITAPEGYLISIEFEYFNVSKKK